MAMDKYLAILEGMGLEERKLFLQSEAVIAEKSWLELMLDTNRRLDDHAKALAYKAQQAMYDYEMYKDSPDAGQFLTEAEVLKELATDMRQSKYPIKDIRKQREKIQWEAKKLNQLKKNTELKPSLET